MSFSALPIESSPYKRWAALTPDDSTVYDPAPDAILVIGSTNRGTLAIVGSDDVSAVLSLGSGQMEVLPFSPKKVLSTGTSGLAGNPIGLWLD